MSLQVDKTETNVSLVLKNFRAKFAISIKMKEVNFLDRIFNKITSTFYEKTKHESICVNFLPIQLVEDC